MLIVVKKEEAEMLLNSIRELEVTIAEMDGEEEGSHGFMPSQLISLRNVKNEIEKELKSSEKRWLYIFICTSVLMDYIWDSSIWSS